MNMGFKETFIRWIEKFISRPWISPLINGRGVGFFQSSRGLQQGWPLSPFLYILVAEALSRSLEEARFSQHILRIKFKEGIKSINHGQFVDDTTLLGAASPVITRRFQYYLHRFQEASRGKTSDAKCRIYAWNISLRKAKKIEERLGFKAEIDWKEFKYLGVPIFLKRTSPKAWKGMIEKMKHKITNWGGIWLNPAGRLIFIKSVLSSLPIY